MPTRNGWLVVTTAAAAVVSGRVLGLFELFLLGAGGVALVGLAALWVRLARVRLDIERSLHPPRVHAGSPCRVELEVRNRGPRRTPVLTVRDPVGSGRSARVLLAPMAPGSAARAAYRLPTEKRGILPVGPLRIEVSDPFGLTSVSAPGAPLTELTVWPAIEDVVALPHTHGDDPHGGSDHPNALSPSGEDFYALRPYVVGDDLRRVHWRSTARRDDLVVRQDEMPWQGRATVVLDTRAATQTPVTFERSVSAAASIVVACARRRFLLRLLTTDGDDSGVGAGHAHVEAIMERLATVQLAFDGDLAAVLGTLRRPGSAGALAAVVGGRSGATDLEGIARLRASFPSLTAVVVTDGRSTPGTWPARAGKVVVVDDATTFATAWNQAAGRGRPRTWRAASAGTAT